MSLADAPSYLQSRIKDLPEKPGVYLFKGADGKPVYIGKALSLKKRVLGHFRYYGQVGTKEGAMLSAIRSIDTVETPSEAEALLLEASLVKETLPKYNKLLRDDKSFPYLKITAEPFPRLLVVRSRKSDGGKYFGPYTSVYLLRQAVQFLRHEFPLRTCRKLPKKVCLLFHIGLCGGPCEGHQSEADYSATVRELEDFLKGHRAALVRSLSRRMKVHAAAHEFEKAKDLREAIRALSSVPVTVRPQRTGLEVLSEFQRIFSLPALPKRIDCFDISNIHGKESVGSMVVFIDGESARQEYRRFKIRTVAGIDDYRMMREVVGRRYSKLRDEGLAMPDLVLIDGGRGHLNAAKAQMDEMGLGTVPLLSIAKQHEILFAPGRENPYVLTPSSEVLRLIRHIRDEAHRFAITYHRKLHREGAIASALDRIPGVGEKTAKKLLKKIGSVAKIRHLSAEELAVRAGIGPETARRVKEALGPA